MRKPGPSPWNELVVETLLHGGATLWKNELPLSERPDRSGIFRHSIGLWRGQTGDFRTRVPGSMKSIHLVEYGDRYEAHVDSRDPHSRPLEHLVLDVIIPAAGMALAASAAGKLFKGVATRKRKQR